MTCEELHKDKESQAYKDCVAQKKSKELNTDKVEEVKLDEVVVEGKKEKQIIPTVKKDNLNYQDNKLEDFKSKPEEPTFWNKLSNYLKIGKTAISAIDLVGVAVTKEQSKKTLQEIELPGNGLSEVSLKTDSILTEDQAAYDPTFVKIGKNVSTTNIFELEDYEGLKLSDLAVQNLTIQYNKTDTTGKPFEPTPYDVFFETQRILDRASIHFEKDNTLIDAAATAKGLDKDSPFLNMMSNFWKASRSGFLTSQIIQPLNDMVYGDKETKAEGLAEYYRINAKQLKLNSTSDATKKYLARKKELGGGGWAEIRAMAENPEAAFSMAIESGAMNAGVFINSREAIDNALENTKQVGMLAATTLRNPYAVGAALTAAFLGGGIQIMERSLTADRIIKDELAKQGISIEELSEEDFLDLLGDKKFMEDLLKYSENRGTVANAAILLVTWATYMTGGALKKRGASIIQTMLGIGTVAAVGEGISEGVKLETEGLSALSKEGQEQIVQEMALGPLNPGAVVGTTTSLLQGTQENITSRKATDIAKNSMFPNILDVFKQQTAAGVEIIKAGFSSNQLTKYLNGLKFNNKITKEQQTKIESNFQNLQKNITKLKNVSKDMNLSNDDIAYLSDLLTKISKNNKIIKSFTKDAPGLSVKFELENDKLNEDLAKFFEEKSKLTTEGLSLDEVVITADNKKVEGTQANKIKDLWDKEGIEAADKINKNVAITSKINKILDIYRNRPDFKKYREDIKIALLNDPTYGVLGSLLTFDETRNPNLLSHIIGRLNLKHPDIVNNILPSGEDASFSQSIETGGFEGKNIDIEDTDATTTEDAIDIKNEEEDVRIKAIDKLRKITGITPEETKTTGTQIAGSKIRTEPVKGVQNPSQRDTGKAGTLLFGDRIIEAMGGVLGTKDNKLGNYITFLELQGQDILDVLSSPDVNEIKNTKLKDLYNPKKVDRVGGVQNVGGSGKGIFEYSNPTVQDLITWATDPSLAPTTKIARQRTLADILGNILGRVSTVEAISTKEGKKEFEVKQEIQGNKIKPGTVEKLIKDIDVVIAKLDGVGKNQMGSGVSPALIANLLSGGLKILKSGIQGSVSLAQALGRLKRYIASKAKNSTLADIITRYFVDKATNNKVNEINESSVAQLLTEFAVVEGDVNVLLTKYDQAETFKLDTPKSIDAYLSDFVTKLAPFIPRTMIFKGSRGMGILRTSDRTVFRNKTNLKKQLKVATDPKKIKELKAKIKAGILNEEYYQGKIKELKAGEIVLNKETIKVNWGPDLKNPDGSIMTDYSQSTYEVMIGTLGKIKKGIADGTIKTWDDKNVSIFNQMWERLDQAVKADKTASSAIGNYLSLVANDINHWHKMGASFIAYSNDLKPGEVPRMEHAMVATGAYIYLLDAVLSGKNFTTEKQKIMAKYKLAALKIKADDLINKVKVNGKTALKTKMTPGWILETGKWFDRYFNILVAALGGIDPKSMTMVDTGKTVAETYNITFDGRPELVINEANNKSVDKIAEGQKAVENNPNLIPKEPVDLSKGFNIILEESEGIGQDKVYSDIGARKSGRTKGGYKFFMPPGAQDFELLIYNFLSKGKLGEKQKRFFEENLFKPYSKGIAKMENYRAQLMNDFEALKKLMPSVNKKLGDKIKGSEYTNSQAIRVFLWDQSGFDIPGISKTDKNKLIAHVNKNPDLIEFANGLTALSKQDQWAKPDAYWDTGSIIKDVNDLVGKIGRKQQLEQFVSNAGIIFSKENLNKIEAVYGIELREALQDILYRMKNGTNRPSNSDRLTNSFTTWLNNSVGAIMFMNTKSATLQLLSMLNYINHRENSPIAVAKAVLNVKQYGKDIYTILSSPKIKRRFAGEGRGVNEAEISSAVSNSTNKMSAMISYLLKIGFTPTRAADAAAIALGGAPYYRNKINAYKKQGLSDKEAEAKAWDDFSETTEKFQQSSDPMLISQQQASILGRFILAFQNTPMQYTRSMVKDGKDLTNRRRISGLTQSESDRVYISRILYYGAIQNFMFAALSNALFALIPGFDDEEKELDKEQKLIQNKQVRIINNMIDTVLRGSGIYGAIVSTLKNVALKYNQEEGKTPFNKDHRNTLLEIMNLSPPIGSKFRKINNALKIKDWDSDIIEKRGWDVMMDGRVNLSPTYSVFGNVVEGATNIPLARMTEEVARLSEMLDSRNTSMQRIALGLGWRTWDVNADNEEHDLIKIETKQTKEQQRKQKVIDDRAEKKRLAEEARFEGMSDEEIALAKRKDEIFKTTSKEQKTLLLELGLTKNQVKGLKYEKDRVNKIIELLNKEKDGI